MATIYTMRAFKTTAPTKHVYWTSVGSADLTGVYSGFDSSELSNIQIDYSSQSSFSQESPGSTVMASGDLSGSYPNPTVEKIQGRTVLDVTPTDGQVLGWNGVDSSWQPINQTGGGLGGADVTWSADLSGSSNTSQTVSRIKGTAITTSGGALAVGSVLRATAASTADWGALNLADTDAVTGVLPAVNQASQTLGGNLSGTTANATVASINGASVPAAGSLVTGNVLRVTGASALSYGLIANNSIDPSAAIAVNKLAAGTDGQVIKTVSGVPTWSTDATGGVGSFSAGGDLSGTENDQTVIAINGATVPESGSLVIGQVLRVTGVNALAYGAIDLANPNAATGQLPVSNGGTGLISISGALVQTTASQTLTNKTLTLPIISAIVNTGTLTLPTSTDTLVGRTTVDTLANKTIAAGSNNITGIVNANIGAGAAIAINKLAAGTDGQVIKTVGGVPTWSTDLTGGGGSFTASGDLSGNESAQTVIRVNGATVPVAGALTTGQILRVTGVSTLAYGALDLANANSVTGALSVANGGTGLTSLGAGIAAWLGTPSSANLLAAMTDDTGTGLVVFDTSPTFRTSVRINNPANTFAYTLTPSAIVANRNLTLPLITADDTIATLAATQTFTNKSLTSPVLRTNTRINNPANTFAYILTPSAIVADRTLTLPLLTANDTLATIGATQTFTNKTLTSPVINTPNFGSNALITTGNVQGASFVIGASGPTITVGTGVPATAPPNGSLFLRSDGTSTTTAYVRAAGAWAALGAAGSALSGVTSNGTTLTTTNIINVEDNFAVGGFVGTYNRVATVASATPSNVFSVTIPTNSCVKLTIEAVAKSNDHTAGASYVRSRTFLNNGTTTTALAATDEVYTVESSATWDLTLAQTSNVVNISIRSAASVATTWVLSVRVARVG